jgi:hypothetical protein
MVGKALKYIVLVAWAALAFSTATMFVGCGPLAVSAKQSVEMDVRKGPPCVIEIKADGEVVSTVQGPKKCNVEVTSD